MKIDNVVSRVTFTRKFPSGCGHFTSFSSPIKQLRSYTRDFPPGCGPSSPKSSQLCSENYGYGSNFCMSSRPGGGRVLGGSDVRNLNLKLSRQLGMKGSDVRNLSSNNSSRQVGVKGSNVRNLTSNNSSRQVGVRGSDVRNLTSKDSSGQVGVRGSDVCILTSNNSSGQVGVRGLRKLTSNNSSRQVGVGGSNICNLRLNSSKELGMSKERKKVLEMLRLFREKCDELSKKGGKRVDMDAYKELVREGKLMEQPSLALGFAPGVKIGDKFNYRAELRIVGLHRLLQGGIDSMECNGDKYATCIVANEGHMDRLSDPNMLIYIGEGGNSKRNSEGVSPNQKLTGGNLALSNSRKKKKPVRVVRGLRYGASNSKIVYVYDGCYEVTDVVKKKGPQGNIIFEFQLTRNPGQPAVQWSRIFA